MRGIYRGPVDPRTNGQQRGKCLNLMTSSWLFHSHCGNRLVEWSIHDVKLQGTSSALLQAFCIILQLSVNSNWIYSLETSNLGQNRWFFATSELRIWQLTLKNNRAHQLCYLKLCASLHGHRSIQTPPEYHFLWYTKCTITYTVPKSNFQKQLVPFQSMPKKDWVNKEFVTNIYIYIYIYMNGK